MPRRFGSWRRVGGHDRIDPLDLANYFDNLLDDDEIKQFVDDPALQAATRKGVPHTGLPPDWRDA